jgi:uncharacterized protein (TIGR03437 family)
MSPGVRIILMVCLAPGLFAEDGCKLGAPCYTLAGTVNGASFEAGALAPNTLVSIFGTNLSFVTKAISFDDVAGGVLPTELPATGVRVHFNNQPAHMYYVSPTQVNLLVPSNAVAGASKMQLVRDGTAGPSMWVEVKEVAPALFLLEPGTAVASRADFSVVTKDAPARPGEIVILWATGLGPTVPRIGYGQVPLSAVWIERIAEFHVLLNEKAVPAGNILYAGVAPYFGGLYQINMRLPEDVDDDPEVRIAVGDAISPVEVRLPVRK